ncbi:SusC/RagA family TonB-linked outer membrane protein [Prolixibacter denitrificans]|uniref:SusC/RagA family TonB-linked outer membrane protein n=1 Tax=Prolixibacter denitrificans TaxID=1541063 RepID=A0A2P8CBN2_9BACT|nr:SusC/RagA family TonB-linked outer membrane protein [Prolixibacter denitrificans]PSK82383.1 TonB-linked SusC/RagA family outer membrane protein [Prolixibacter denitrificans]GET22871.1 SusC/RagA family TonB-linked outer membrane protein [Prolixibacter denitrificans]
MRNFALLLTVFLFSGMQVLLAQTRSISGTVTSADDGTTLPGVSVAVKGTTVGTITDMDGHYQLNVPQDAKSLVFSFVGMKTTEQPITGDVVNVKMTSDVVSVDEVVVTALGIKKSEKAIGYASTTVNSDQLTETRNSDVVTSLSGKVAGVEVSNTSTDPGASNSIIIRGVSSLSGSNQPLFVVDGVPMNNSSVSTGDALNNGYDFGNGANMVNPDDVASMTILKGAAATALYGSRAANGVVLITTKSGSKGKGMGIQVNSGIKVSDILRLPDFQNQYGMGWSGEHTMIENGSWGPAFDGRMHLWGRVYNNSQKLKPFVPMKNNVKDFFDYGFQYSNSISFSGAEKNTDYFASFSQVNDNGMIPGNSDTYNKYTGSFRGSHNFGNLKVSTSLNYGDQKNHFSPTGQGLTMINSLYQIPRDISIVGLKDYKTDPFNSIDYFFTPYGITNPYYLIDNVKNEFRQKKIFGKVQFDYNFLKHFTATYRFGLDATDNETKYGFPKIQATKGSPNEGQVDDPGTVSKQMSRRYELNHDAFVNYTNTFNKFDISVLAGLNANERTYSSVYAEVKGLDIPTFYDLSNSAKQPTVNENFTHRRLIGVFSNATVSYNDFLFLTLSARNDWSSTLPKANNSFFYPGTALSFVFTKFMNESAKRVLTFGKLRLSYGKTGNDADPYKVLPYYTQKTVYNRFSNITFPLNNVNAFSLGNVLGNVNLSPEISTEYEFGMNLRFFNGRIVFDGDYYNRTSDKQIFQLGIDPATGYTAQNTNLGKVSNKGVELLLTVTPIKYRDFSWDVSVNYSKNKSNVESLPAELGGEITLYSFGTSNATTSMVATVGKPVGTFKVTMPERSPDGKIVVNPSSGQPVPDSNLQYAGNVDYDYTMGVSNNFHYKGWSLGADLDIRQGGEMYSRTADINYFTGNAVQTLYNDRRPFIVPNSVNKVELADGTYKYVENTTPIPKQDIWNYFQNGADKLNAEFLIPRSYVKLRSVVLGYSLPRKWMNRLPFQSVKLSVFGSNLFVWTPKGNTFIDPEVTSFGNDLIGKFGEYSANPTSRRVGFNLQLNL